MKIKVDIDCTPEEARAFLGLPDVAPMQRAMMDAMQERMEQIARSADPESLMKAWFPAGMQGLEAMQKMFWNAARDRDGTKS
ncbi:MAG TPA: DUF6489 family protein [Alphaproteobacteria bacterium]|nr:DUF6489 family protein [Alphaproteobacteria bacterium]